MRTLTPLLLGALALGILGGCTAPQEEPWVYRDAYLKDERDRSPEQLAELRNRLNTVQGRY